MRRSCLCLRLSASLAVGGLVGAPVVSSSTAWGAPAEGVVDTRKANAETATYALGFDPTLAPTTPQARSSMADLGLESRVDGGWRYVDPHYRFTATFEEDGSVRFADPWRRSSDRNPERGVCCGRPPRFSFGSWEHPGPTEWLMYMSDQEPLRREKAELLEKTREARIELAKEFVRKRLDEALGRLEGELDDVLTRPGLSDDQRRTLLFELWDECEERAELLTRGVPTDLLSDIDVDRLDAAERARATIAAFIRNRLPQGSATGYAASELDALNARRVSVAAFRPYQVPTPVAVPAAAVSPAPTPSR